MADTCFLADDAPPCADCDRPALCAIVEPGTRPCDPRPHDPALVYFPHVGFDGREVDVLAEMMAATKIAAPPNVIRAALYHYAMWLKIENLHHDDFQLRKGTL